MSCAALEYANIWKALTDLFALGRNAVGDDGVALALLAILMLGVVKALELTDRHIRPKVVAYVANDLREKARIWLNRGLTFLGFNLYTATVSLFVGAAYYFVLKASLRFPEYWWLWIPILIIAFLAIAVVGFVVSGNVPKEWNSRWKYCKASMYQRWVASPWWC